MRILAVTSDDYVGCTRLLLESLRVWHAEVPVQVYALSQGWTAGHERLLTELGAKVEVVAEADRRFRTGAMGQSVHALWKLDLFRRQREPFLFLDSDMLVLKRLDGLWERIERDGWVSVHEGTGVYDYNRGQIEALTQLPQPARKIRSFNTGVVGCNPKLYEDVFNLACEWGSKITQNYHGDQGLLNLAFFKLRGYIPDSAGTAYNGGWHEDDRLDLGQTILHFARPNYGGNARKLADQSRVWGAWPKGVELVNLTDTEFWKRSLPHPWTWLNQSTQKRYRGFVKQMRERSLALKGQGWLVVRDRYQAYLLDDAVLREVDAFWAEHGQRLAGVKHLPTYHLTGDGTSASLWRQRLWRKWLGW